MLKGQSIAPRYWLRLLGIGFTSTVGTIWSLPERILFALYWTLFKKNNTQLHHPPGVLIIIGYYRSGTTHAHNLLACNPNTVTPRWYQSLMGQGFWFSWAITRFLLVPFLGSSRPQDGVGFGPLWPAEDDFALAGWGHCSTLPGRLIFPHQWDHWQKWNTLENCTPKELRHWKKTLAGFAWKITRRHPHKRLILKTPSHGSHITELTKIFGNQTRFLHISRDPTKVIQSNLNMHDALSAHLLQNPLPPSKLRSKIIEDYLTIERATHTQAQSLPQNRIAHLTHENLIADPIGQLRAALATLQIDMSQEHEQSITQYLRDLGPYQRPPHTNTDPNPNPNPNQPIASESQAIEELQKLSPATTQPHTKTNTIPTTTNPSQPTQNQTQTRTGQGILVAITTTLLMAALWIGLIWIIKQAWPNHRPRLDPLVWIAGSIIGLLTLKAAGTGSKLLGYTCALLTVLVFVAVSFPITVINWNFASDSTTQQFLHHNTKGAIHGLTAPSSFIFALLGLLTAHRHASTTTPPPPK